MHPQPVDPQPVDLQPVDLQAVDLQVVDLQVVDVPVVDVQEEVVKDPLLVEDLLPLKENSQHYSHPYMVYQDLKIINIWPIHQYIKTSGDEDTLQ